MTPTRETASGDAATVPPVLGDGCIDFVRHAELLGAEVMDVKGVSRKWSYFHETYSFCSATWVAEEKNVPWRYRQRTHQMNQGGVQLMEPGELHANLHVAPHADFRVLLLAPSTMLRLCRELGAPHRLPHLTVAQLDGGAVRQVLNKLTGVLVEQGDVERGELGLYRLVETLWKGEYLEAAPPTVFRERGRKAVLSARDLIHASWNEHLPIATLIDEVKLPLATLERTFRDTFGTSPRQYQLRLRLMRAKELFRNGETSVAAVSRQCGFRDPKYFSRLFKREFGCQPTDYLRAASGGRRLNSNTAER